MEQKQSIRYGVYRASSMSLDAKGNVGPGRRDAERRTPAVRRVVASNDNAFRSAQRHSSRVRLLRVALPAAAVVMLAGFFGYTYLVAPSGLSVGIAGSGFTDGKLVMADPKLEGVTKDNLPYSMRAARAIQDVTGNAPIALEQIDARLPVDAENFASVVAASGLYDRTANTLDITSDMTVTTTDGVIARLKTAHIEIASGNLTTADPVDISLNGTKIAADSLSVAENGKVFLFDRSVRVTIEPQRSAALAKPAGDDRK